MLGEMLGDSEGEIEGLKLAPPAEGLGDMLGLID